MAQTGYTPILIYASGTTSNVPLAANLTSGAAGAELALNYADGKLFYKDGAGNVQVLAGKGGTGVVAGSNTQLQFNNNGVFGASSGMTWDGTNFTATSIKDSALTSGRVTFAGASGLLSDSASLTWDGTNLTASQLRSSGLTSGRVTFAGASGLLSDSANLTWNGTTLGITGALTASADSAFTSTGAVQLSSGTTGQRPAGAAGKLRFNTTTSEFEGYNGTTWASVGGSAISNDTSTATNLYPLFASSTTGTAANVYTSNAQYLFKPSTGELSVKAPRASNGIVVNSATISSDYTIATGDNGMSAGPVSVNSGITVTVSSGSTWVVV